MKLLINICSNDGISSHYSGVGTIVKRYIETIIKYLEEKKINYDINLFTVESDINSLGYSEKLYKKNLSFKNTKIFKLSNGSKGKTSFGTIENWKELSDNTGNIINSIQTDNYDMVITMANDTPYCSLVSLLDIKSNHKFLWIPHSTALIHKSSSDNRSNFDDDSRLTLEKEIVNFINHKSNCYIGASGLYIKNHLIKDYGALESKLLEIYNGEVLDNLENLTLENSKTNQELFSTIKNNDVILLSFARAEKYKNLEGAMNLACKMKVNPVIITQSYYKEQEILKDYRELSKKTNSNLFVDPPFNFPHYIVENYKGKIILLIPSKNETFGLIINEFRKMNKENLLIVANNVGGLSEQIEDGKDGILINIDDIDSSANKILGAISLDNIKILNINSQNTLKNRFNLYKNMCNLMELLIFDNTNKL